MGSGFDIGWYPDLLESEEKWRTERPKRVGAGLAALDNGMRLFAGRDPLQSEIDKVTEAYGQRLKGKWYIGVCLTFAKIKETKSVLVISGIACGLGGSCTGTGIEASYVFGGKMTPVKE